ncbi:MAG: protein kinase [Rickettsiales bacterium]|jgi:serine/threonine protein kinase|nr:protein kinase [Rickettsiales bacterium]
MTDNLLNVKKYLVKNGWASETDKVERLGEGGCNVAYKVKTSSGEFVVKKAKKNRKTEEGDKIFYEATKDKGIPDSLTKILYVDKEIVMMEKAGEYDLEKVLENSDALPFQDKTKFLTDLLDGYKCMHDELGISHEDIKPGNIVIDSGGNPKIIDYGFVGKETEVTGQYGTPYYMSPEIITTDYTNGETRDPKKPMFGL